MNTMNINNMFNFANKELISNNPISYIIYLNIIAFIFK